jgi:hypothetical protein
MILKSAARRRAGVPASTGNGEGVRPLRWRSERMKKEHKHYTAEEKFSTRRSAMAVVMVVL